MKWLTDPSQTEPCVLVLGSFDGVHLGHQALIRAGIAQADRRGLPLAVCTFWPYPRMVLGIPTAGILSDSRERAMLLARSGVDLMCVETFTPAFAAMHPEEYIRHLTETYHPACIICGFNFSFGYHGLGTPDFLRDRGAIYGYDTEIIPSYDHDGRPVSSSRIRELILTGDVDRARTLLGHPYSVCGRVIHGIGAASQFAYPTANVRPGQSRCVPEKGVYAALLTAGSRSWPAVCYYGCLTVVGSDRNIAEVHIPLENPDLYGAKVRLTFLRRLADEGPVLAYDDPALRPTLAAYDAAALDAAGRMQRY